MNKLELTKYVTSFIVGAGTTRIVSGIINNNTEIRHVADQVTVISASVVIGSMASAATRDYTNAKIDEVAAWYRQNITSS